MDTITPFLDNPEAEYHVREIARKTGKSPTTISRELRELKKKDLITARKDLQYLKYKANAQNAAFKDLKLFHNISSLRKSEVIDYLVNFYNQPPAIVLFGSFRKAENIPSSDIDLCIITSKKEEPSLLKYEKKLKHPIQLFLLSKHDLVKYQKTNPQLLNNIINGLVLEGFLEVF